MSRHGLLRVSPVLGGDPRSLALSTVGSGEGGERSFPLVDRAAQGVPRQHDSAPTPSRRIRAITRKLGKSGKHGITGNYENGATPGLLHWFPLRNRVQ